MNTFFIPTVNYYRSQSVSTSTDKACASTGMESLSSLDEAVKVFRDRFAAVSLDCLLNEVNITIKGLEKSICQSALPNLQVLQLGYSNADLDSASSDYKRLLALRELREVLGATDDVKVAGTQTPDSKSEKSKSIDKESETEQRRLKTQMVNTSRWESLDWNVPCKRFNHLNDYTMEYNTRMKLTDGSSSRIHKLKQWYAKARASSTRAGYVTKFDATSHFGGGSKEPVGNLNWSGIGG